MRDPGIIHDGAVLIVDGRIAEIGMSRRVEALAVSRRADEINATGRVVAPGFVDCHTHLVGGPIHSLDLSPKERLPHSYQRYVQQTSQRTLELHAVRALEEFVRCGTTTVEAKSGFGMDATGEMKILRTHAALERRTGMIASTFMGTRWAPEVRVEEYVDWMCSQILPVVRRRGLAEFADISCDLFPVAQVRRYLSVAKQLGLLPKAHAGRTPVYGAIPEAARIGAVSVDHAVMVSEEDVAALAASNTIATLLPGPVFFTGAGRYAPARRLIDEGVAVALATNFNPQTSPSHNMQMMMSLACRKMGMTPAEAMCAATINGAHAMRRADRAGSIEVDKAADIVMFAVSDYRDIPFHFGTNLVEMTLKDGAIVYQRAQVRWPVKPPARAEAPRADTRFSKQRGAG